jgi:uncharacterized protein with ParB-like and HNH nuclease domain
MSIQPFNRKIEEIFSVNKPYYIDFYQRDYKWTKEHIDKLLEDLFYRFELEYNENIDPTLENISNYNWYYLSTYLTNSYKGKTFIVDGQQRLTSITLILIKLYHLAIIHELKDPAELLLKHVRGVGLEGKKFWMGWDNREAVLQDLLENSTGIKESKDDDISVINLYKNYRIIDKMLESNLNTLHKFESFFLYFLTKVLLVEIQIDEVKDVPMVFEVINDRGERLKPYEVLKGKLLGQLDKNEVDVYNEIWDYNIHNLQNINEKEADNFFRFYFRSKFVDTPTEYREFDGDYHKVLYLKKWNKKIQLKQNIEEVKSFVKKDLDYYAKLYLKLMQESDDKGSVLSEHLLYNSLNDQDRQYLLILSSCDLNDPQKTEKVKVVAKLFDRYYTMLQLTGSYDSNMFTESILNLNKKIRNKSIEDIKKAFNKQLIDDISKAKGVEIKTPFEWSYFRDANRNLGIRFIRYFFGRIEHFIAENCKIQCENYYDLVRNTGSIGGYHIEHIIADNEENRNLFGDEELFHSERNRLGALTLLKGRDNLSSGNESYSKKLRTYSGKANLVWTQSLRDDFYHSNRDFIDFKNKYKLNFKSHMDKFDKNTVDERQKLLFDIVKVIWDLS